MVQNETTYRNPTTGTSTTQGTTTTTTTGSTALTLSLNTVMSPSPSAITYNVNKDKYVIGDNIVHGEVGASVTGLLYSATKTTIYYFWQGIILYNKKCYDILQALMTKKNMTAEELLKNYPDLVHYLGPYPWHNEKEPYYDLMINYTYWNSVPVNGDVLRVFDLYKRNYKA